MREIKISAGESGTELGDELYRITFTESFAGSAIEPRGVTGPMRFMPISA